MGGVLKAGQDNALDLHQTFLKKSFKITDFHCHRKIVFLHRHSANERQAKKAKGELVTSRQSFGQLCPFSRSNYEFFQLAQFFNLKIGLSWKFLSSRQSRSRRTTSFPHFLPADFSPSLTSLVNTISKDVFPLRIT